MSKKFVPLMFVFLFILVFGVIFSTISFADSPKVKGYVVDIETNQTISLFNVSIYDCSTETLLHKEEFSGGFFEIDYSAWSSFSINFSDMDNYISSGFINGSSCFSGSVDSLFNIHYVNTTSINVTVIDDFSGRLLPNAEVNLTRSNVNEKVDQLNNYRCVDNNCYTDNFGNIILITRSTGTYNISVNKDEYTSYSSSIPTIGPSPEGSIYYGESYNLFFTMNGTSPIYGRVIDNYNSTVGVGFANVTLMSHEWSEGGDYLGDRLGFDGIYNYSTTADSQGYYFINVPGSLISSDYNLNVEHDDYNDEIKYETSKLVGGGFEGSKVNLNLNLDGVLPLSGNIYDCANSGGVENAHIVISGPTITYNVYTDADGNFSLNLKDYVGGYSAYSIFIDNEFYDDDTYGLVSSDISSCLSGSYKINGSIVDKYRLFEPELSGVSISVDVGDKTYSTISGGDGSFDLDVVSSGVYDLYFTSDGYQVKSYQDVSMTDDYDEYYIELIGSKLVDGKVKDNFGVNRIDGEYLENVTVDVYDNVGVNLLYSTQTDDSGNYGININSEENHFVCYTKDKYNTYCFSLFNSENVDDVVSLNGTTRFSGKIIDQYNLKNVTYGSRITFFEDGSEIYDFNLESGSFDFYLGLSEFDYKITREGYLNKSLFDLVPGVFYNSDIYIKGKGVLEFNTYDNFSNYLLSSVSIRLFDSNGFNIYNLTGTNNQGYEKVHVDSTKNYSYSAVKSGFKPVYKSGVINDDVYGDCLDYDLCSYNSINYDLLNLDRDRFDYDVVLNDNDSSLIVFSDKRDSKYDLFFSKIDSNYDLVVSDYSIYSDGVNDNLFPKITYNGYENLTYIVFYSNDDDLIRGVVINETDGLEKSDDEILIDENFNNTIGESFEQFKPLSVVLNDSNSFYLFYSDNSTNGVKYALFNNSLENVSESFLFLDFNISSIEFNVDSDNNIWAVYSRYDLDITNNSIYFSKYDSDLNELIPPTLLVLNDSYKRDIGFSFDNFNNLYISFDDNVTDNNLYTHYSKIKFNGDIEFNRRVVVANESYCNKSSIIGYSEDVAYVSCVNENEQLVYNLINDSSEIILEGSLIKDDVLSGGSVFKLDGVDLINFYVVERMDLTKDIKYAGVFRDCTDSTNDEVCIQKDVKLPAVFEANVKDMFGIGKFENVKNAFVSLYHNFNYTNKTVSISPTNLNVTVFCDSERLGGVNVVLNNTDYQDIVLSNFNGVSKFEKIPVGVYNIIVNGSDLGCGADVESIDIDVGGINYTATLNVDKTILYIFAMNPLSEKIYPANVSYDKTIGERVVLVGDSVAFGYYDEIVPSGNYDVYVNNTPFYEQNNTQCDVSDEGGLNECYVYLKPAPGNFSVRLINETTDFSEGVSIFVLNNTDVLTFNSDEDGYSNFTNLVGVYNISVDGSSLGYSNISNDNILMSPLDLVLREYNLEPNVLVVNVTDEDGDPIEDVNVSIYIRNTVDFAVNASNDELTIVTSDNGLMNVSRVYAGVYNLTLNLSAYGFYFDEDFVVDSGLTHVNITLEKTKVEVEVLDQFGLVVDGINVSIFDKASESYFYEGFTDENGKILFDSDFVSGLHNLTIEGVGDGYNYTSFDYVVSEGVLNEISTSVDRHILNVSVLSEFDLAPLEGVKVDINATGGIISLYSDENGEVLFDLVNETTYNVTINYDGDLIYLNSSDFEVDISGYVDVFDVILEDVLVVNVLDDIDSSVIDGVEVSVVVNKTGEMIRDSNLEFLDNVTNESLYGSLGVVEFRDIILNEFDSYDKKLVNISVDGLDRGYNTNMSYSVNLTKGVNEFTLNLSRTRLLVNVTTQEWDNVASTVNMYIPHELDEPTTNVTGEILSCYNDSGICTFSGLIAREYNVTAINGKTVNDIDDFALITLESGKLNYLWLDPPVDPPFFGSSYYDNFIGVDNVSIVINVSFELDPIEDVVVSLYVPEQEYSETYKYISNVSDSFGLVYFDVEPGIYDIKLDGFDIGYGQKYLDNVSFGKLVMNQGYTDSNGFVSIPIDGRFIDESSNGGYHVKVFAYGYSDFDTFELAFDELFGSYYDYSNYNEYVYGFVPNLNNNRYDIQLLGNLTFYGYVYDKYAINAPNYAKFLDANIKLLTPGEEIRYSFNSNTKSYFREGSFLLNTTNYGYNVPISNYVWGANSELNLVEYTMVTSKDYYNTDIHLLNSEYHLNPFRNVELVGNTSLNGTVYSYETNNTISQINVSFKDQYNNMIYSGITPGNGSFVFNIDPTKIPYSLHFRDPTLNTLAFETSKFQQFSEQNNDLGYYLLFSDQGVVQFNITDDELNPIEDVKINLSISGNSILLETDASGLVETMVGFDEFVMGTYDIVIDGSHLGYERIIFSEYIDSNFNSISRSLDSTRLNVSAITNTGDVSDYSEDIKIVLTGIEVGGVYEEYLNLNDEVLFNNLPVSNYTVSVVNSYYFAEDVVYSLDLNYSGDMSNYTLQLLNPMVNFTINDMDLGVGVSDLVVSLYNSTNDLVKDIKLNDCVKVTDVFGSLVFYDLKSGEYFYEINGGAAGYPIYLNKSFILDDYELKYLDIDIVPFEINIDNIFNSSGVLLNDSMNVTLYDLDMNILVNSTNDEMSFVSLNYSDFVFRGVVFDDNVIVAVSNETYFTRFYNYSRSVVNSNEDALVSFDFVLYDRDISVEFFDLDQYYETSKKLYNSSEVVLLLWEVGSGFPSNTDSTEEGVVSFSGVDDGLYYLQVSESGNLYGFISDEFGSYYYDGFSEIFLKEKGFGYINFSTNSYSSVDVYYNNISSNQKVLIHQYNTGSNGISIFKLNSSKYGGNISIEVEKEGFVEGSVFIDELNSGDLINRNLTIVRHSTGPSSGNSYVASSKGGFVPVVVNDSENDFDLDNDFDDNDSLIDLEFGLIEYKNKDLINSSDILINDILFLDDVAKYFEKSGLKFELNKYDSKLLSDVSRVVDNESNSVILKTIVFDSDLVMLVEEFDSLIDVYSIKFDISNNVVDIVYLSNNRVGFVVDSNIDSFVEIKYEFVNSLFKSQFIKTVKTPSVVSIVVDNDDLIENDCDSKIGKSFVLNNIVFIGFFVGLVLILLLYYGYNRFYLRNIGLGSNNNNNNNNFRFNVLKTKGFKRSGFNSNKVSSAINNFVDNSRGINNNLNNGVEFNNSVKPNLVSEPPVYNYHNIHNYNRIVSGNKEAPVVVRSLSDDKFIVDMDDDKKLYSN
jgi:hypothetical protein